MRMLRAVCALGNEDKQRSSVILIIVTNSVVGSEQNGLGKLKVNFNKA